LLFVFFAGRLTATEVANGGKSGLRRAECQVTPGECEFTASAAENIPPNITTFRSWLGKGEKVR
jgi:hypothetical protein